MLERSMRNRGKCWIRFGQSSFGLPSGSLDHAVWIQSSLLFMETLPPVLGVSKTLYFYEVEVGA